MKIYTRTGDKGETSLIGGKRVKKNNVRVEAYGEVDELNTFIGLIRSFNYNKYIEGILKPIQKDLFVIGSNLASQKAVNISDKVLYISPKDVTRLENKINAIENKLSPTKHFILPSGGNVGSLMHVARAVCRRAERRVVSLSSKEELNSNCLIYLNRLSDLLFVLSRYSNKLEKSIEDSWHG
mgnify:CR=1 FL=1